MWRPQAHKRPQAEPETSGKNRYSTHLYRCRFIPSPLRRICRSLRSRILLQFRIHCRYRTRMSPRVGEMSADFFASFHLSEQKPILISLCGTFAAHILVQFGLPSGDAINPFSFKAVTPRRRIILNVGHDSHTQALALRIMWEQDIRFSC